MSGETFRWFGTTVIAGAFGLIALFGIIILADSNHVVPDVLTNIVILGAGGFFTAFGAMVGGRASQNGAQVQSGQALTGGGLH